MKNFILNEKEYPILLAGLVLFSVSFFHSEFLDIFISMIFVVFVFINIKSNSYSNSNINIIIITMILLTTMSTFFNAKDSVFKLLIPSLFMIANLFPRKVKISSYINRTNVLLLVIILISTIFSILSLLDGGLMEGNERLRGIFNHPNNLALYCMLGAFCSSQLFIKTKNNIFKILLIILFVINLITLYMTGSRTSLIAVFVFALLLSLFLLSKLEKKKRNIILFVLFIIVGLIIFIFNEQILSYLLRGSDLNNLDLVELLNRLTSGRFSMWTKEIPYMMQNSWLIGNGIDSFWRIAYNLGMYDSLIMKDVLVSSHNFIIDVIFVSGITGLILLVLLVYEIVKLVFNNFSHLKNYPEAKDVVIIKIISIFCTLLYFSFEVNFMWIPTISNVFLFIEVGILINILNSTVS